MGGQDACEDRMCPTSKASSLDVKEAQLGVIGSSLPQSFLMVDSDCSLSEDLPLLFRPGLGVQKSQWIRELVHLEKNLDVGSLGERG